MFRSFDESGQFLQPLLRLVIHFCTSRLQSYYANQLLNVNPHTRHNFPTP